jgi:hypothetical protein
MAASEYSRSIYKMLLASFDVGITDEMAFMSPESLLTGLEL